jgi:acetyl-CoA carboxylase biotin carboxylase subunit
MFEKILIANRGEIALRVVRTCREMGIRSVVVYSTADRDSAAVRAADESVHIGSAAPRRSYLYIPAIIEAAARTGAQAIHPGYGFLSEDPDFAEVTEKNGFVFIGPPANVLDRLGDKATARSLMSDAGLPLLPGSLAPLENIEDAEQVASEIGYPLIIKAVAGGGGRGMRVANCPRLLAANYGEARADAQAFFGDSRVYMERYLTQARHVEIQILRDWHGNTVCLGERDCSVQRRHQKLIEETPAPGLTESLLARMRDAAVRGAEAAGYVGAGTFEFLVDEDREFYFMEVNSRIQVEHPVTEMATGLDLIREQIRIADGQRLGYTTEDIRPRGAVIECRVNAEDPDRNFMPTPGIVNEFRAPDGPFVRVDTHVHSGYRVPPDYDSMIAKVIVSAPDRDTAIARMLRSLEELVVDGPGMSTTAGFLSRVLDDSLFRAGEHSTALAGELLEGKSEG